LQLTPEDPQVEDLFNEAVRLRTAQYDPESSLGSQEIASPSSSIGKYKYSQHLLSHSLNAEHIPLEKLAEEDPIRLRLKAVDYLDDATQNELGADSQHVSTENSRRLISSSRKDSTHKAALYEATSIMKNLKDHKPNSLNFTQ
jgi:hypothetical protein